MLTRLIRRLLALIRPARRLPGLGWEWHRSDLIVCHGYVGPALVLYCRGRRTQVIPLTPRPRVPQPSES